MALSTPTLKTARLLLRPFAETDADALFDLHSNAHAVRYWDSPPWTDRERAARFLASCRRMTEEGSGVRVAIERLSDAAWGHGCATEASRALLQWAFDTVDLDREKTETDTRNLASAREWQTSGDSWVRTGARSAGTAAPCPRGTP